MKIKVAVCVALFGILLPAHSQNPGRPSSLYAHVFHLAPGQLLKITNDKFLHLSFRAEYPISVAAAGCDPVSEIEWHCQFKTPSGVVVQDIGTRPRFKGSKANAVGMTASEQTY